MCRISRFPWLVLLTWGCVVLGSTGCDRLSGYLAEKVSSDEASETTTSTTPKVSRRLCAVVQIGNLEAGLNAGVLNGAVPGTAEKKATPNKTQETPASLEPSVEENPLEEALPMDSSTDAAALQKILNDPSLSEEEKSTRVQTLLEQEKAERKASESPEKDTPSEEDPLGLVPSASMATTEEDLLLSDIPIETIPGSTTSEKTEEISMEEIPMAEKPAETAGESTEANTEIDSFMDETIIKAMDDAEKRSDEENLLEPLETTEKSTETQTDPLEDAPDAMEEINMRNPSRPDPKAETDSSDIETAEESVDITKLEEYCAKQAEEFLRVNQNIPSAVKKEIQAAHFQNYSVWMAQSCTNDYYAVRYLEYVGTNFDVDYLTLIRSPEYRKWMRAQAQYLRPMASLESLDVWLEMNEIWRCD